MLFAMEPETTNNLMIFTFGFVVIFGYFAYRLISKCVSHTIRTREVDQYAKHIKKNKNFVGEFSHNEFKLATREEVNKPVTNNSFNRRRLGKLSDLDIPVKLGRKAMYTQDLNPQCDGHTIGFKNRNRYYTNINPQSKFRHAKNTVAPLPAYLKRENPNERFHMQEILLGKKIHVEGMSNNIMDILNKSPNVINLKKEYIIDHCPLNIPVNVPVQKTNLPLEIEKKVDRFAIDLKKEFLHNPVMHGIIDKHINRIKQYDYLHATFLGPEEGFHYFLEFMGETLANISKDTILIDQSIRSFTKLIIGKSSLIYDLLCMLNEIQCNRVLPEFNSMYKLVFEIIALYTDIPIGNLCDLGVLQTIENIYNDYNKMLQQYKLYNIPVQMEMATLITLVVNNLPKTGTASCTSCL